MPLRALNSNGSGIKNNAIPTCFIARLLVVAPSKLRSFGRTGVSFCVVPLPYVKTTTVSDPTETSLIRPGVETDEPMADHRKHNNVMHVKLFETRRTNHANLVTR